jgi:lipopolysaccharide export system ATP-binding protein
VVRVTPVLAADSVGKRYGDRWVLRSASLRAVKGEVRALVGRNGAGKSTLLRIAAGAVRADTGGVFVNGAAMLRPSPVRLARHGIFHLPDQDLLSSSLSLARQFRVAAAFGRTAESDGVARHLGLESLLDRCPQDLSTGERRRAEVATAVLCRPACLMADEPLRGIAPLDRELLLATFRAMASAGCAVVVTGHEVPEILGAVDQVTWCTDGTTYELGAPVDAVRHDRFVALYLAGGRDLGDGGRWLAVRPGATL